MEVSEKECEIINDLIFKYNTNENEFLEALLNIEIHPKDYPTFKSIVIGDSSDKNLDINVLIHYVNTVKETVMDFYIYPYHYREGKVLKEGEPNPFPYRLSFDSKLIISLQDAVNNLIIQNHFRTIESHKFDGEEE